MAQPVWLLSVDLQTKTATFQSGLADAARAARGAFNDIKTGAGNMAGAVNTNMFEARHGVMLLGEEFGIHLPRALTAFLTSIGPIGAAMEAAFPFLAIAVGATLLIQHLATLREAGHQLTEDQIRFGTESQNALNALDDKLLQAGIRADELRNDHLGALKKQLELIDHQSMAELTHTFTTLAKAADDAFKDLKTSWYSFGAGSAGAKNALDEFKNRYESLLALGHDKEAADLLRGTRESAQRTLASLKESVAVAGAFTPPKVAGAAGGATDVLAAVSALRVKGLEEELQAQQTILAALDDQIKAEGQVAALKKVDSGNAKTTTGNEAAAQQAAAARAAAESMMRMGEQAIAADRAMAEAKLTVARASLEARLASDVEFAGRERDTQLAANGAELSGLDKSAKDYTNQVKANKEKALEIQSEYNTKVAELTAKASIAENARDLQATEQAQREKIEAAQQGSAERLAAINSAIKAEQSANLQDTSFYRELLNMRVETQRQETEQENKLRAEAAKEGADNDEKLGALSIAAEKQRMALADSARRVTAEQRMAEETKTANEEFENKMKALDREAAGLDKSGKDYDNKLVQMQNHEKQLVKEHANEIAAIKDRAEEESNARILAAEQRTASSIASGLTQSIMGHQTWAKMVVSLGDQAVAGLIKNSLMVMMQQDKERLSDARTAAAHAYATGEQIGGPAGVVLGPVFAAAAFAGVMAFNEGTDSVPGIGRMDTVPARLTPGEGVVPGGVMDGLSKVARAGGFNGGGTTNHAHFHATYHVHTIDGDGMQDALEKNTHVVTKHIENTLRRMNK
jgi:hypothetical protein